MLLRHLKKLVTSSLTLAFADFYIEYRSGKCNIEADAFSRIQWPQLQVLKNEHISCNSIQAICVPSLLF